MEDTSSASSDSDNALLSPTGRRSSRIECNVSTQTPEMPRHEIRPTSSRKSSMQNDPNSSIIVYKLDAQKPISELEQEAKTLAIPNVVVEYIKDSYNFQDSAQGGISNPAYDSNSLIIVRTPSSISLRDDVNGSASIGENNRRLYSSMPRTPRRLTDQDQNDVRIHSQPSTPKFGRMLKVADQSLSASNSSLGYPRSIPPSPNFGYRPLESETSAVYTIIAPAKYTVNGSDKETELRLLAQIAQLQKDKSCARKFEYNPAPPEIERKRHRLQCLTDTCSMMFLIPGIFIAVVTPVSLIPMFMLPLKYYIPLIAIFIVSGCVAVLSLAMSGLTGNLVWHYDPDKQKLRPRLHCGRGPLFHFWGNGCCGTPEEQQTLNEKIV